MNINIALSVGKNCITRTDGEKLYEMIVPELKDGNKITVDFQDVNIFATPFFNASFGRMVKDFDSNDLNTLIEINNLSTTGLNLFRRVIKNSVSYYNDPSLRSTIDEVLSRQEDKRE